MGEYRLSKDTTAHYTSIEEMIKAHGKEMPTFRTKDENKLTKQREKFLKTCPACGSPMKWNGGNVLTCSNENCRGRKIEIDGRDGEKKVFYVPIYRLLDETGEEIANNLFG